MSRTNKADHPRERLAPLHFPTQPEGIAPLEIRVRTDSRAIVYDPRRALGERTIWEGDFERAEAAARELRARECGN